MYLETYDRQSLFHDRPLPGEGKPSPFEEAVRKDSAVHVSLSSDSPVKQPGDLSVATPHQAGSPIEKPTKQDPRQLLGGRFPHVSEELQARHRADSGRRAVWPGLYVRRRALSTEERFESRDPQILRDCSN